VSIECINEIQKGNKLANKLALIHSQSHVYSHLVS